MDLSSDPKVMQFGWAASSVLAAVVNGTTYGSHSTSAYLAKVSLDQQ